MWKRLGNRLLGMELKNKLIVLFLAVAVIPLGLLGAFSYRKASSVVMEKVCETILENLSQVNHSLDYFVKDIEQLSMYIYSNREIQEVLSKDGGRSIVEKHRDEQTVNPMLETFVGFKNWDIQIYLLGENGDRYFTGDLLPSSYGEYNPNWGLFRKARAAGGNVVWDTHYSMKKTEDFGAVLSLGRLIKNIGTNRPLGYLVVDIMEPALADKYNKAHLYPGGQVYLLDRNGYVISGTPSKQQVGTKLNERYVPKVLEGRKGFFRLENGGNGASMVIYDTSQATGFKLVSVVPVAALTKDSASIRNLTLLIVAVGIAVSYWLAYGVSVSITKPLRKLRTLMRRVEDGNLDVSFPTRYRDEIGQLGKSFNTMLLRIKQLINEVYEKQLKVQEAEMKAIQAQFNPHFLYNALDSINWMARIHKVEEISRTVVSLGELLRFSIRKSDPVIPIREDLQQIRNYLVIQKTRYGNKFEVRFDIDEDILSLYTPKLLIQPLVENAITHGLEMKQDRGTLTIRGQRVGDRVRFVVADDGAGMDEKVLQRLKMKRFGSSDASKTGIGLENLDKRLQLYFGDRYKLDIESAPRQGTVVTVEIPVMTRRSEEDNDVSGIDRR